MNKKSEFINRSNEQAIILDALEELWLDYPDWRFMQLVENVLGCRNDNNNNCFYHIADERLLHALHSIKHRKHEV